MWVAVLYYSIGNRTLQKQEFEDEEVSSRRNADPQIDILWTLYVDRTHMVTSMVSCPEIDNLGAVTF